jgi:RNA-directed DNA polymerase
MEEAVSPENYGKALRAVIANKGAPGIDGMTVEEWNGHRLQHWPKIPGKWMAGTYVPSPVRRGGNRQAEWGNAEVGNPDGTGSDHPAEDTAGNDANL